MALGSQHLVGDIARGWPSGSLIRDFLSCGYRSWLRAATTFWAGAGWAFLVGVFRRSRMRKGSLKWTGAARVTCDALDQRGRGVEPLTARIEYLSSDPPPTLEITQNGEVFPDIVTAGFSRTDPSRPAEVVIDSSINGYPSLTPKSFKQALRKASGMAGLLLPWWQESGWATLSIMFVVDKEHHRSTTHKDGRDLEVWVSLYSNDLDEKAGARQALEAIEMGLALAARRARITVCSLPDDLRKAVLNESQPQMRPRQD